MKDFTMEPALLEKLTSLVALLKNEGKTDLVALGMKALECLKGGNVAEGMKAILEASSLDERFKEFLGADGDTLAKAGHLAKMAGGLLGRFKV